MFAPRTVKTLTALFLAMTIGTLVLAMMAVDPIRPRGRHLAAVAAAEESQLAVISRTDQTLAKWRSIVVHSSVEGAAVAGNCHFLVDPEASIRSPDALCVRSSGHWLAQEPAAHVPGRGHEWNDGSIGVCLVGDFSRQAPSDVQWQSLIKLVTDLQQQFRIPPSRVYLYRNIGGRGNSPGAAFPEKEFNDALLAVD